MVDDYKYYQVGNAQYPLTSSLSNSLLKDSDPALYAVINFIKNVLKINLGDRWNATVNQLGFSQYDGYIVNSVCPCDPVPTLQEAQFKFPLLAVYRGKGTYEEFTVNHHRKKVLYKIDYILPPLDPGPTNKLFPILNSVENTILSRMMLGFDPAYMGGAKIFGTDGAYIDYIRLISSEMDRVLSYINSPNKNDAPVYRYLHMEMEIRERDLGPHTGFELLNGVDGYIQSVTQFNPTDPIDLADIEINNE